MRTLDALKKLFVAQGGDEDVVKDLHTDAEVIDKIADNGSGGNIVVVSVTADQQTGTITADKNYDELLSAVMDNTPVIMAIDGGIIAPFSEFEGSGENIKLIFSNVSIQTTSPAKMVVIKVRINPDNSVEVVGQYNYSLTAAS